SGGRDAIPGFPERTDEIGDLADSLKEMTAALYDRIGAIERFAADVAHELKNPLTSLASAMEMLGLAATTEKKTPRRFTPPRAPMGFSPPRGPHEKKPPPPCWPATGEWWAPP